MTNFIKTSSNTDRSFKNYDDIASTIKNITGIDVFENSKRQPVVDVRAMMFSLLNVYYNESLCGIARYFTLRGRKVNHSTVYYNIKMYDQEISKRRHDLDNIFTSFTKSIKKRHFLTITINHVEKVITLEQEIELKKIIENYIQNI